MEWFKLFDEKPKRMGAHILGNCISLFHVETARELDEHVRKFAGAGEWTDNRVFQAESGTTYHVVPVSAKALAQNEKPENQII